MASDLRKNITLAVKLLFYMGCIFALFLLVYNDLHDKWSTRLTDEPVFIEEWTVYDSKGESFTTGRQYRDKRMLKEDFTIVSVIPENACDDSYLCFANRGTTRVYVGGELRKDFDSRRDVAIPLGEVKSYYMTVPLKLTDAGKELRIEKEAAPRRTTIVSETFMCGMGGIYSYLFKNYGITFALAEILSFLSFGVVIVGIGMRIWYRQRIDMLYAAFGIFINASWAICDSYLYPFVYGHYHIDGLLSYIFCLMLPFGYLLYLDSIQKGRHWKLMSVFLIISSANLLLWTILHFTGIVIFPQALEFMDSILGIVIVGVFAIVVIDYKQGGAKEYKYTAFGFSIFMLVCIFEIINIIIIRPKNDGAPMVVGLLVLLTFVVLQQVDDLRKINIEKQRAIELSDAKTAFLASMSHEIRTPINSILGMNEMILRENKDPEIGSYAKGVQSSGRMLLSLINDVLDFSKIEAGKLEITKAEFSMAEMLAELSVMFKESAVEKGIDFDIELAGIVPNGLVSDEVRLKQVLINLINNAVKYTDKGKVTLGVSGEYEAGTTYKLRLNVKDTGRGIKEEEQKYLFDAFTRADVGKNRNIEGTGLGLAIVKNITNSLGGKITVDSEYGKGSDFCVTIPVGVTDRTPVPEDFAERPIGGMTKNNASYYTTEGVSILAVDDNRPNLSIVELFLKRTGITPDICTNGTDAVSKCKEKKYDLILLDHMMPDPDGIATLGMIRSDAGSKNKETPVVVLTANAVAGSRQMYLDAGFVDHLTKPLDPLKLEEVVFKYIPGEKIRLRDEEDVAALTAENTAETGDFGDHTQDDEGMTDLERRLSEIKGLDFDTAMANCGDDEEILRAVLAEMSDEAEGRIIDMNRFLAEKNYERYGIDAHAIKGLMATIGLSSLSERAKKHEFAAKEGDLDFIEADHEGFLEEYGSVCDKMREI